MHRRDIFVIIGLEGSGKTAFFRQLYKILGAKNYEIDESTGLNKHVFSLNLDAASQSPFREFSTDIRDTRNVSSVMRDFNVEMTQALNIALQLFLTWAEDIYIKLKTTRYSIVDTSEQFDVLDQNNPACILMNELLKIEYGFVHVLYLIDSVKTHDVTMLVANMLYVSQLPVKYPFNMVSLLSKIDLSNRLDLLLKWLEDYNNFIKHLPEEREKLIYENVVIDPNITTLRFVPTFLVSSPTEYGFNEVLESIGIL